MTVVHNDMHALLTFCMLVRFRFFCVCLFRFCLFVFFHVSLAHFVLLLLAFVMIGFSFFST